MYVIPSSQGLTRGTSFAKGTAAAAVVVVVAAAAAVPRSRTPPAHTWAQRPHLRLPPWNTWHTCRAGVAGRLRIGAAGAWSCAGGTPRPCLLRSRTLAWAQAGPGFCTKWHLCEIFTKGKSPAVFSQSRPAAINAGTQAETFCHIYEKDYTHTYPF